MSNALLELTRMGQSVWLDNLTRTMLRNGALSRLVDEDGLSGVTSNPAIFHKAMTGGAYKRAMNELVRRGLEAGAIYERLAIEDVRSAAEILRPVFDQTHGTDGFVSLEVSPRLADDTARTVDEATRLWREVDRPNVLIKIPGTEAGVPAIEACLALGINVNATLLFSLEAHRRVILAYWRALEARMRDREPLDTVASVASYFLSRIDVAVDRRLDRLIESGRGGDEPRALRGRAAIANAKLAYRLWRRMHESDRWRMLERAGARVQKPLWASTSTKDPAYSDVRYVEALIGPHTVNTMPERTLAAFRDHGRVAATLERRLDDEERVIERLRNLGIDPQKVAAGLLEEGVVKFTKPFDALLDSIEERRQGTAHASSGHGRG